MPIEKRLNNGYILLFVALKQQSHFIEVANNQLVNVVCIFCILAQIMEYIMEKLVERLKSTTSFSLIMACLSITWLIIDYFVMGSIIEKGLTKFSLEWILLIASGFVYLVFTISVFIMIYYSMRVSGKLKSMFSTSKPEAPQSKSADNDKDNSGV